MEKNIYTKIVDLHAIYNFAIQIFFIWNNLHVQIINAKREREGRGEKGRECKKQIWFSFVSIWRALLSKRNFYKIKNIVPNGLLFSHNRSHDNFFKNHNIQQFFSKDISQPNTLWIELIWIELQRRNGSNPPQLLLANSNVCRAWLVEFQFSRCSSSRTWHANVFSHIHNKLLESFIKE
jgi:hypothetical protein